MVIQNSTVAMRATTVSLSSHESAVCYAGWGGVLQNANQSASTSPSAKDSVQNEKAVSEKGGHIAFPESGSLPPVISNMLKQAEDEKLPDNEKMEYGSLKNVFQLTSGSSQIYTERLTPYDLFKRLMSNFRERLNGIMQNLGRSSGTNTGITAVAPTQVWGVESVSYDFIYESESMTYTTTGNAVTADGRTIEFDITAEMSRSFCEYTSMEINYSAYTLIDPLVISLDGGAAQVTDRKFLFDIDMDGEKDNISILAETCGFLALDGNGDGIINNGSELFGAKSGDGFAELAVFDLDKNGWIDENDEVFNRLRIWTKDNDGNDRLIALGVAGIGAVYLGNIETSFTVKSETDNSVQAEVRKTGIFLTENGSTGLVQELDMAVEQA